MTDAKKSSVHPDFSEPFTVRGLTQAYNGRTVLDIPGLTLVPGRRYALIGANGSGKSTLLRLLAGRLADESGNVGYLPQDPYAFSLSVSRNIRLGIPPGLHLTGREKELLAERQLSALNLGELASARGDRLSGGEAQRMALARLLIVPRKVLLVDEPTTSLDLASLTLAEDALTSYLAGQGSLFILASHQLSLARRLCSDIIFLDQGRMLESGPISMLEDPPPGSILRLFLRYEHGVVSKE